MSARQVPAASWGSRVIGAMFTIGLPVAFLTAGVSWTGEATLAGLVVGGFLGHAFHLWRERTPE